MTTISITHTLKDAQAVLDALPRDIYNAQRSAERDTVRFATKEMQNRMTVATGIPARVFRRFRVKSKNQKDAGIVWLGVKDVAAAYLGKMQQLPTGAKAGQYFFEGAFVATMKSGHESLWRRIGRDRTPIEEMKQEINVGYEVADDVARLAEMNLRDQFRAHVLKLNPHLQ